MTTGIIYGFTNLARKDHECKYDVNHALLIVVNTVCLFSQA